MRILQIGAGGFGRNHVKAWMQLGRGSELHVADLVPANLDTCRALGLPDARLTHDFRQFLADADLVDIVTPSDSHYRLASESLAAGKPVFIEKPMTMTAEEADKLARQAADAGRPVQVGYYYRFHPMSRHCRELIARGDLGELRYLGGTFMGFKRARTDVGVTHTDAIHFLDLFNWLTGQRPARVFAVTRDHFGRGMEDLSLVVLEYASGLLARVESGYVQPGRWRDKVVPNAFTSKEVFVVGSRATAELDFETEQLLVHDVHHELVKGIWTAVVGDTRRPNAGTASPVDMVAAELDAFVNATRNGGAVLADIAECGVLLAREIEAIYESARRREPVALQG